MADIYEVLQRLGIPYRKYDHPPVATVAEADRHTGRLRGGHSKNLFLRNKKGNRHYLVTLESHRAIDLKALRTVLGEASLSFASPERLNKHLGLLPGAVSPFGIVNDTEGAVVVVVERGLLRHDPLNFHPNVNTSTLAVSRADFERFLAESGNEVRILELPE